MRTLRLNVLHLLVMLSVVSLYAQQEPPMLRQRVTDFTNSLTYNEWRSLESRLQRFEDSTSTQIVILLVKSLDGASIEDYSMRVFEANKFGQKEKDNGVLVVVSKEEHKIRIDVGYGLEGVLTDALNAQIIDREIKPYFKANNFFGGLSSGVSAIMAASVGQYKADAKGRNAPLITVILVLFFIGFLAAFVFPLFATKRRYVIRSGNWMYHSGWGWGGGGLGGFGGGGGFSGGSFGGGGGFSGGGGMAGGGGATGNW